MSQLSPSVALAVHRSPGGFSEQETLHGQDEGLSVVNYRQARLAVEHK